MSGNDHDSDAKKENRLGKLLRGQDGNSKTIARDGVAVPTDCRISSGQKVEAARRGRVLGALGQ